MNVFGFVGAKALIVVRQHGLKSAAGWLLSNAFTPQRFTVFEYTVPHAAIETPKDPEIEVRQATPEELCRLRASHPSLPVEFFYDRIYGLRTCLLALYQGRVAGVEWFSLPGDYNRYFDLEPGEAEIFQLYVMPEFRSLPLVRSLIRLLAGVRRRWMQDRSVTHLYARVKLSERALASILLAAGFRRVGHLTHFAFYCPKFRKGNRSA